MFKLVSLEIEFECGQLFALELENTFLFRMGWHNARTLFQVPLLEFGHTGNQVRQENTTP